jgi:hypothetical protein
MNKHKKYKMLRRFILPLLLFSCSFLLPETGFAQEDPPTPIVVTVSTLQHLSFGTFIQNGVLGTVTVTPQGSRFADGSIILPTFFSVVTPSLFVVAAQPGTLITINNGPDSQLTGSNGGFLTLQVGEASTGSTFITSTPNTEVFIGGTLVVGSVLANPPGEYSGVFQVTFIQQ